MRYRHYKGGEYIVIARATLEATHENMIVYRRSDDHELWIRPESEFFGTVEINNEKVKRFEPIN